MADKTEKDKQMQEWYDALERQGIEWKKQEKDLDKIPDELIRALRYLSMSSDRTIETEPENTLNWYDTPDTRAAYEILHSITGDELSPVPETAKDAVLSLVNNPNSENREYISNNMSLLRAFPILKQVYGYGSRLDNQEKQNAISDFSSMFGKENVPEHLRVSKKMPEVTKELSRLRWQDTGPDVGDMKYAPDEGPVVPQEREIPTPEYGPARGRPTGPELTYPMRPKSAPGASGTLPEDTSVETLADTGLVPKYKTDDYAYMEGERPGEPDEIGRPAVYKPITARRDETKIRRPITRDDYEYMERERPGEVTESYEDRGIIPRPVHVEDEKIPYKRDDYTYMEEQEGRQRGGMVGYQEGGDVPLQDDPAYNEPSMGFVGTPEGAIDGQVEAAQEGEMGKDEVNGSVPEGSFVLNSYAVELAGIKDIEKLIDDAKKFVMERMGEDGFATQTPTGEDVEVLVSEGEYIIPPALVRIIGRDRLEKINKRGIEEFERQQTAETEEGGLLEAPQGPQGFMPPEEGGAPMPPEAGGAPMPQEVPPEQVQGFAVGGVAQEEPKVGVYQFLNALGPVLGKGAKPATAPKQVAQAPKQKAGQPAKPQTGGQRIGGQPPSPLARVNPTAPGAQNLQKPNVAEANMGGFVPYSRHG